MILLVTNRRDVTSDHVVLELQRRGRAYARLNTEDFPRTRSRWQLAESGPSWTISFDARTIDLNEVSAAYLRRPIPPDVSALADAGVQKYATGEWVALLEALYVHLDGRWLNCPSAMALAENKLRQITLAAKLGFSVPATLVSNDAEAIAAFAEGSTIAKPLRSGMIASSAGPSVVFTSRIGDAIQTADAPSISVAPFIVQREIIKAYDIRVTVVGKQIFSTAIHSQDSAESRTDWRRGNALGLSHAIHDLPSHIKARVRNLADALGLRFSAIDLVLDRNGAYWFLEINPNGQWAWVETLTGLPIAAAIVDELERVART